MQLSTARAEVSRPGSLLVWRLNSFRLILRALPFYGPKCVISSPVSSIVYCGWGQPKTTGERDQEPHWNVAPLAPSHRLYLNGALSTSCTSQISTTWRCHLLHLINQNCFRNNFLRTPILVTWVSQIPVFLSRTSMKLQNISLTPKIVKRVITNLDSSHASDLGGIPVVVLRNSEPEISS